MGALQLLQQRFGLQNAATPRRDAGKLVTGMRPRTLSADIGHAKKAAHLKRCGNPVCMCGKPIEAERGVPLTECPKHGLLCGDEVAYKGIWARLSFSPTCSACGARLKVLVW